MPEHGRTLGTGALTKVSAKGDISQLPVEGEVVLERLGAWTGFHAAKEEPILEDRQVLSEIHLCARADLELFIAAGPPAQEEEIVIDARACPVKWTTYQAHGRRTERLRHVP